MFHLQLKVLARGDFLTGCLRGSLCGRSKAGVRKGPFWFKAARANVTSMDGFEEGVERIVGNAQGAARLNSTEAAVIDPVIK
jgi:hypothetical protein